MKCVNSQQKKYLYEVCHTICHERENMIFIVWILEGYYVQINHDVTFCY